MSKNDTLLWSHRKIIINCWCCARLKQELKSAIIELESAIETIRKLREVDICDAIEVMSNTKSMQKKCSENDPVSRAKKSTQ
jgi:hypothetical protein